MPTAEMKPNHPPITAVHPATLQDADAIQRLNTEALGHHLAPQLVYAQLKEILSDPRQHVLVAKSGFLPVGYAHLCTSLTTLLAPAVEIVSMAVHPAWQGRGIGGRLLFTAEMWARQQSLYTLRLGCGATRRWAQDFFLKNGFDETDEEFRYSKLIPKYPSSGWGERPAYP